MKTILRIFKLPLICCLLFFSVIAYANEKNAENVVPDKEIRSTIIAADGYSFFSEDRTIKQMRKEAEVDARRKVIEDASMHVKSMTKLENLELTHDIVESQSEAEIKVLERNDFGIEENRRYHVWIKAEVRYSLKPPESSNQPVQSMLMNKKAPLTVKVWTDKKSYRDGEEMKIYVEGNKPFYGRILYQSVAGEIIQLLPNKYRMENYFRGGYRYIIPYENDAFVLEVTEPFGMERIIVYASTFPLGSIESEEIGKGLLKVRGGLDTIGTATRGIKIKRTDSFPVADFYEAEWEVETGK